MGVVDDACTSAAGNLVNINVSTVLVYVFDTLWEWPIVTTCSDYNCVSM